MRIGSSNYVLIILFIPKFDAITLTRKRIEGQCPLFGFCGAPWTLMAYMTEGGGSKTYSKAKKWLYQHEEASNKLLDAITNTCIEFLIEQANAGAQLLQVFERGRHIGFNFKRSNFSKIRILSNIFL